MRHAGVRHAGVRRATGERGGIMPELPEVETVRAGLAPVMEGRRITGVELRRAGLRWPFPKDMAARLRGCRVMRLRRRGKYILVDLSSGETLLIHLGMSGRMLISGEAAGLFRQPAGGVARHDHVVLEMDDGVRITLNDARRFGMMDLWPTEALATHRLLAGLGPEPLGNAFDEDYLAARLKARRTAVKTVLLDQGIVAGLGNIYVCEVLHRTAIAPRRRCSTLTVAHIGALVPAIREVLREAIAAGGASLRDHRQASGELGYFQHRFRVYDRQGAPCPRPGCGGVIVRTVQAGRSTFHCPACQR